MSARELITEHLDLWTGAVTKKSSSGRGSNGKVELTGVKKLRELILELAVHGKLVEQYHADTPAHQLLERITEHRKELISAKRIKNSKPLPPVAPDEAPSKLPAGWAWTRLGSIAEINPRNAADNTLEASFIPMPLVTTSYHGEHGDEPRNWGEIKKGYSHFANGDVGLAKITPCFENSKAAVFRNLSNGIGAGTTELHVARPLSPAINPYFLLLFLKSPRFLTEGEKVMTGSAGQKRVPKDYFSGTPLPLPPAEEQHRIVQKVDELMALCDRLEQQTSNQLEAHETLVDTLLGTLTQSENATELADNWARLAAHFNTLFTTEQSIDKLKQTILQLAVMGRLVEQDAGDEPASVLLGKLNDRRVQVLADKKTRAAGKIKPVTSEDQPFHLPTGWAWCRFEQLVDPQFSISYGVLVPGADATDGVPLIRVADLSLSPQQSLPEKRISPDVDVKHAKTRLVGGEILLCVVGSIGKIGIAPRSWEGANIARAICRLMPSPLISREFLLILVQTTFMQEKFGADTRTLAQPTLNVGLIKVAESPLPPVAEQKRIVQKVDELMALCDHLKQRLNQASETRNQMAEAVVEGALN